ncbi:MAG TPA: NAD(P)/FAD-dependent oxidoreductase [Actinomycetota bacterium]|jgi:NADH dehydrogenase
MTRVLVVGGGYAGMLLGRRLQRRSRRRGIELTLVNPENFMQYQPFLPEAAAGNIEPRHVVVPLRQVLKKTRFVAGDVVRLDHDAKTAHVRHVDGSEATIPYDVVVVTAGSHSRILPVPGLAEHGVGFKTLTEAIYLRNRVLSCLEVAAESTDPERRRRALTFVFVGGGYAGVEAMAELEDMARSAMRFYPMLRPEDMRWAMVEAAPRILTEIGERLSEYATRRLRKRGIAVYVDTRLESAEDGVIRLSNGEVFPADTLVWTTGVKAESLAARSGLPVDGAGRLPTDEFLRVQGVDGVWACGDCAAVPDVRRGGINPPTAQHALFQSRRLAKNLVRVLKGGAPKPFRHRNLGQIASLGLYRGVANPLGIRVRGFPAWFLHRTYHLLRMPTTSRKVRIVFDWTVGLFFPRDIVQLGSLQHPREPFRRAAGEGGDSAELRPSRPSGPG